MSSSTTYLHKSHFHELSVPKFYMGFVYRIALILWSLFLLQASSLALAKTQQQDMVYNVTNFRSDTKLAVRKCNLYRGQWIVDNSYPLYNPLSCPFIDPQFDCIKYGRPDRQYLKYSWKPDSCNLPRGKEWNSTAKNCYREHQPLTGSTYPAGEPAAALTLKKVLNSMKKPVHLLDITLLSQLRIDGHPSAYSGGRPDIDCAHWCLPGVPDTWNHLLYAALITSSTPPSSASSPS